MSKISYKKLNKADIPNLIRTIKKIKLETKSHDENLTRLNGWNKKYLLKESFKHVFPKNFLNKSKKGFEVPVGDWLRNFLKEELLSYIDFKLL